MNINNTLADYELIVSSPSTWALRAWICLKLCGVEFITTSVSRDVLTDKTLMADYSDTGLVPVLNHGGLKVHDSLSIAEFVAEQFPTAHLYPADINKRAQARSLVAEVHSGFGCIRTELPFFIGAPRPTITSAAVVAELKRLSVCWDNATLPFYFDAPGIVDAFYSVMAARLHRYQVPLKSGAKNYQQSLLDWPLLQEGLAAQLEW